MSRFYITTAIPYANGAPHIGHAYERIATDAIQRFMRLDGRETLFVTGMDEHGLKVQQAAAREGVSPQQFVDRVAAEFEAMGDMLNARADDIVRTTQPRNDRASQAIWERMAANGDIYLSKYSGWYSVRDEGYFVDSELTDGPDGTKLAPSGAPVELGRGGELLLQALRVRRQAIGALRSPSRIRHARDLSQRDRRLREARPCRSLDQPRDLDWGMPVPGDPKHVMYVWVDALTNYITATGFPDDGPRAKFWPADAHVIGKDITRFHAIYWPAFLMSAGLPVPKQVVVHGFLFNRGEKMSKSVGNVVGPKEMVEAYGLDPVRYFFLREVPFGQDGSYSHEAIVARMNADLANDIGNLAQRSLTMIARARRAHARLARGDADQGGSGDARARRRAPWRSAPAHAELCAASLYRRRVRGRVGGQSLFRQRRALEARQERSCAHGARALRDDRNLAHRRDPAAAGDAGEHGRPSRPPWRLAGGPHVRGAGRRRSRLASSMRRIGSSRAGRCPRLRRSFLATSKRSRRSEGSSRRPMTIIDSHCHLDFPDFADDLDGVVERARAAGVERMITIGTKVSKARGRGRDRGAL